MDSKTCTKCGTEKPLTDFYKSKKGKFGVRSRCKACVKEYTDSRKEQTAKTSKQWYEANKSRKAKKAKQWREANRGRHSENSKRYYRDNRDAVIARTTERVLALRHSIPDGQEETINRIWQDCPDGYEVDHIYPMSKGGPTSVDNLCYLPMSLNRSKNNKLPEGKVLHELLLNHAIIPAIGGTTEDNRLK